MARKKTLRKVPTTSLQLPDALRQRLDAARANSGRSLGEEIRYQLHKSAFGDDSFTDDILYDAAARVAAKIRRRYGAWHENPACYFIFKSALETLLDSRRPRYPITADNWPERLGTFNPDPENLRVVGEVMAQTALDDLE